MKEGVTKGERGKDGGMREGRERGSLLLREGWRGRESYERREGQRELLKEGRAGNFEGRERQRKIQREEGDREGQRDGWDKREGGRERNQVQQSSDIACILLKAGLNVSYLVKFLTNIKVFFHVFLC